MKDSTFTRHEDGSVTVDQFRDDLLVSFEFLRCARLEFVRRSGFRSFSIACANGTAEYRLLGKGRYPDTAHARRVA